jgi:hypothetical protein
MDWAKLEQDKAICRGEMQKTNAVTDPGALGRDYVLVDVFKGCMARQGYMAVQPAQQ